MQLRVVSEMQTPVEKAIWFIESHFSHDVTLDDLARVCGRERHAPDAWQGEAGADREGKPP
jgi:hypothetical protein